MSKEKFENESNAVRMTGRKRWARAARHQQPARREQSGAPQRRSWYGYPLALCSSVKQSPYLRTYYLGRQWRLVSA